MTRNHKKILLAFTAITLLSGCDDGTNTNQKTSWVGWLMGKDRSKPVAMLVEAPFEYQRESLAGNYLAGQFAQYRQDWSTAHTYLDKVIVLDPQNIDLQQRAMVLSMQAGDTVRALNLARKVLEQDHNNMLALLFVGVNDISNQEYKNARTIIGKMPASGVSDFIRPILMGWTQAPDKKPDIELMVANGSLQAYHALLMEDYMGKISDPKKYFVNILASGGADKHMLETMADVFARQGYKDLAVKLYDTLLADDEKNSVTSSHYAALKEKRDHPEKVSARKIETPAQGVAELFYNMTRILYQDQSDESALVFARLSQELNPAKDDVKILIASMMAKSGHMDDAVKMYQSIRPETPGYPEAQRSAADLLEKNGKMEDAINYLEKDFSVTKDALDLIQIGDIYRRADRHGDAVKAYDRAVVAIGGKISSDYWSVLFSRGMSYEQIGNQAKAEEDLLAALEFQPNNAYLLNYLGYSWVEQGKKMDDALKMIKQAVRLKEDDGYIVDSLGWAYFKRGQYKDSVAEMEKAVELVPFDPIINDHLGDAYWMIGRKSEARFQWERAINHSKDANEIAKINQKISLGLVIKEEPVKQASTQKITDKEAVKSQ